MWNMPSKQWVTQDTLLMKIEKTGKATGKQEMTSALKER
jgi:hypothetical protein